MQDTRPYSARDAKAAFYDAYLEHIYFTPNCVWMEITQETYVCCNQCGIMALP